VGPVSSSCSLCCGDAGRAPLLVLPTVCTVRYALRRAKTAVTHPDWTDGHAYSDALRVMMKAFLRDLWVEGQRCHASLRIAAE
jgi:hypothetical protein